MYLSDMRTQLQAELFSRCLPQSVPCSSTVWLSRNSFTSTMIDIWYFVSYWMLSENYFSPRGKIVCLTWTEPELPFCFGLVLLLFVILYFSAWSFLPMYVHVLLQWCYFVVVLFYVLFCDISGTTTLCHLDPPHVMHCHENPLNRGFTMQSCRGRHKNVTCLKKHSTKDEFG